VRWCKASPGQWVAAACWSFFLQVGSQLQQHFKGQAAELIAAAQQSAVALMQLVASHFPGFRDHCIYRGRQVSQAGLDLFRVGAGRAQLS
jgi:hypothetical protein